MGTQKMQGDDNSMEQKIDKEVFDKFFTESYCPVDYTTVKEEFEQIASVGNDIFTGSYEARNLNRENFILYLTSDCLLYTSADPVCGACRRAHRCRSVLPSAAKAPTKAQH